MHKHFLEAVFLSWAPYPFMQASGLKVATCSFPKGSGTYQLQQQFKGDRVRARLTCLQSCRPLCCALITRWTKTTWRIIPALALIISRRAFLLLRLHATQGMFKDWGRFSVSHHSGFQRFSIFISKYFYPNVWYSLFGFKIKSIHLVPFGLTTQKGAVGEKKTTNKQDLHSSPHTYNPGVN